LKNIFYILFVFNSFFVLCQDDRDFVLKGKVSDFSNGKYISDCILIITPEGKTFATNEKGEFQLKLKSNKLKVQFSHLSYQNLNLDIDIDTLNSDLLIKLQPKNVELKQVNIIQEKKINFKTNTLYENNEDDLPNINGFYALNLFSDDLSNEIWYTTSKSCIDVKTTNEKFYAGNKSMHINWNRISGGCNWIGLGIGWDGWSGKDMGSIVGKAAIQFHVRTDGDTLRNLPLALALEDYSGIQAFAGFSNHFIVGGKITSQWTKIIIPIDVFPIESRDLDINNIKQFIIQFEAEGDIYIDEIKIVPFEGTNKPFYKLSKISNEILVDGIISEGEWTEDFFQFGVAQQIKMAYDDNWLYLMAKVNDKSPAKNSSTGSDIWNGDAIELAIGTNPEASPFRQNYLFSDYQIGIKMDESPCVYNWKKKKIEEGSVVKISTDNLFYFTEIKIPLSVFGDFKFSEGKKYGFEIAIDLGDEKGKRVTQYRWSSPYTEGFNKNPSLWGSLIINQ